MYHYAYTLPYVLCQNDSDIILKMANDILQVFPL